MVRSTGRSSGWLGGLAVVCLLMSFQAGAVYQVGDTVANFTLPDADGNPVSLYDYGRLAIIINFWSTG